MVYKPPIKRESKRLKKGQIVKKILGKQAGFRYSINEQELNEKRKELAAKFKKT